MFLHVTWHSGVICEVQRLSELGLTDREVCLSTGVPINTIRSWRKRGLPGRARDGNPNDCPACGQACHNFDTLNSTIYAYLLASYLGDGHVRTNNSSWVLRISLDTAYPEIIAEMAQAVAGIRGKEPIIRRHKVKNCVDVDSSWKSWPCLLPQAGPGRKHNRKIELVDWQQQIVDEQPGQFLRGLIHTDGWRGVNKVHVKGRDYFYPRYQFSNRSDDIRKLFTDTCEQLGIEWAQWTRYHVSVAKRDSVALLDQYVGLKQ